MKTKNSNPPADLPSTSNPARAEVLGPEGGGSICGQYLKAILYGSTLRFAAACCYLLRMPVEEDTTVGSRADFLNALRRVDREGLAPRMIRQTEAFVRYDTARIGSPQFMDRIDLLTRLNKYRRQLRERRSRVPA